MTEPPATPPDPGPIDPTEPTESAATPATRAVAESGIAHRVVTTAPARSVEESAELQGIAVEALVRTLVVRRGDDDYLFVLVPGGRRFDWPKLRAYLGVRRLSLPDADEARRVTGYERGAITPFGATHAWSVIVDETALRPEVVAIGGGARGVNLHLRPTDLVRATGAAVADVSVPEHHDHVPGHEHGAPTGRDRSADGPSDG